jgi:hypothetical protein
VGLAIQEDVENDVGIDEEALLHKVFPDQMLAIGRGVGLLSAPRSEATSGGRSAAAELFRDGCQVGFDQTARPTHPAAWR